MKNTTYILTAYTSKRTFKPVIRKTEKGISAYANRMYNKYGDDVTVEVGYFDDNFNWVLKETWHA